MVGPHGDPFARIAQNRQLNELHAERERRDARVAEICKTVTSMTGTVQRYDCFREFAELITEIGIPKYCHFLEAFDEKEVEQWHMIERCLMRALRAGFVECAPAISARLSLGRLGNWILDPTEVWNCLMQCQRSSQESTYAHDLLDCLGRYFIDVSYRTYDHKSVCEVREMCTNASFQSNNTLLSESFVFGMSVVRAQHVPPSRSDIKWLYRQSEEGISDDRDCFDLVFAMCACVLAAPDLVTPREMGVTEELCLRIPRMNVNHFGVDKVRPIIESGRQALATFLSLRDLLTLTSLAGHPAEAAVEDIIQRKNAYRDLAEEMITLLIAEENRKKELEELVKLLEKRIEELESAKSDRYRHYLKVGVKNVIKNVAMNQGLDAGRLGLSMAFDVLWSEGDEFLRN